MVFVFFAMSSLKKILEFRFGFGLLVSLIASRVQALIMGTSIMGDMLVIRFGIVKGIISQRHKKPLKNLGNDKNIHLSCIVVF